MNKKYQTPCCNNDPVITPVECITEDEKSVTVRLGVRMSREYRGKGRFHDTWAEARKHCIKQTWDHRERCTKRLRAAIALHSKALNMPVDEPEGPIDGMLPGIDGELND